MTKLQKSLSIIGIIILAVVYFSLRKDNIKTDGETIRIGAVLGLTGQSAADSLNIQRGMELAKQDLAARGVTVDINYQDDAADAKKSVAAAQYLLSVYHPHAIVGPVWSYLEEAVAPTIESNKVVAYAPADTSEFVGAHSKYNFRGAPQNALIEEPVTEWLKANNKKKVAIIVDKSAWGVSVEKPYRAAAEAAGAVVVSNEAIPPFSSDPAGAVASVLTKVKFAEADVILWTGYETESAILIKKRIELGLSEVPILVLGNTMKSLLSRDVISADELRGVYRISVPIDQDFIEKFREAYGEVPGDYADRSYDGLMILVEAIQNAPTKDGDQIAAYLSTETRYEGYAGLYEFNDNGDVEEGAWFVQPIVQ